MHTWERGSIIVAARPDGDKGIGELPSLLGGFRINFDGVFLPFDCDCECAFPVMIKILVSKSARTITTSHII